MIENEGNPKLEVKEVIVSSEELSSSKGGVPISEEDKDAIAKEAIDLNISQLKLMRVRVSGLAHIIKTTGSQSMEKIGGYNSLVLVKAWYGEVLETLGEKCTNNGALSKYDNISDETDESEPIKVQLRKVEKDKEPVLIDANDIESINHVRMDINSVLQSTELINSITNTIYETYIYQHLKEAQFWMEKELHRIKAEHKQKLFASTEKGKRKLPRRPQRQQPIVRNKPAVSNKDGEKKVKEGDAGKGKVIDLGAS
jgi:hypothetical protein